MNNKNRLLGGILLVAGTTIGAGMLALPVGTGLSGFVPSIILFIVCWMFMLFTAFLLLEATLWMKEDTNLISIARLTLGRGGEIIGWITYLFLLYALTTAYIAGSGSIVAGAIHSLTGIVIPDALGSIPMLFIFSYFVYKGTAYVDFVNRILMIGLAISYAVIIAFLTPKIEPSKLLHVNWTSLWLAVSLVVTSFGFHIIIPSLTTYLNRNISKLKVALFIGSLIPLFVYIFWETMILGIIPITGENSLEYGYEFGIDGMKLLGQLLKDPIIAALAHLFSFFAILTSFLGVSLSLSDFLADGFKIKKTSFGKTALYGLTFVPPIIFTLVNPRAFYSALEYAGGFGVIILLGFLPALMVWFGRYRHGLTSTFKVPGGKPALLLIMVLSLLVVGLEIVHKLS